jgi:L-fuconolactonase
MPADSIDAHHHLWKYSAESYPWISDAMGAIRRDFLIEDLENTLLEEGITGAVTVQARQTLAETEWLLELADANDIILGVVGWVPLQNPAVRQDLERFSGSTKLKAVRHVVHDEPDDFFILREDFNRGVGLLHEFNLRYDILIFESHLPQTIEFVDRHPGQIFIVDHIAKPRIRDAEIEPWAKSLTALALRENVYCKLSGLVTEANSSSWRVEDLQPYFEVVLKAFGPKRLMFGSDWPVMLVASSYQRWVDVVLQMIQSLSADEQAWIMGKTSREAYRLE